VVVGWSYGGLVLCDYLAVAGEGSVAGYCFAGAITSINVEHANRHVGPEFSALIPALLGDDRKRRDDADCKFTRLCTVTPRGAADAADSRQAMTMCPRHVRQALFRRTVDHGPMLAGLRRPALIVHGTRDKVVLASASLSLAEQIPAADLSLYGGSGHMAFAEESARFNHELQAFADSVDDKRSKAETL
jgi:non-heme chloroperoxidase